MWMPDVLISFDDARGLNRLPLEPTHAAGDSKLDSSMKLFDARTVRPHAVPRNTVRVGSAVSYEELPTGTQRRVTLVVPRDADASAGRISVLSPVGRALLGHAKGQVISVALPMDRQLSVRVLDVAAPEFDVAEESVYD